MPPDKAPTCAAVKLLTSPAVSRFWMAVIVRPLIAFVEKDVTWSVERAATSAVVRLFNCADVMAAA